MLSSGYKILTFRTQELQSVAEEGQTRRETVQENQPKSPVQDQPTTSSAASWSASPQDSFDEDESKYIFQCLITILNIQLTTVGNPILDGENDPDDILARKKVTPQIRHYFFKSQKNNQIKKLSTQ